jgi:integrase/recombinase XerD
MNPASTSARSAFLPLISKSANSSTKAAGFPGFNPHSFRHALAMLGERTCKTPEEFKAWSQNLGHEQVLTTFASYGEVAPHRQAAIIKALAGPRAQTAELQDLAQKIAEFALRSADPGSPPAAQHRGE